jgi:hypothetical protein
VRRHIKRALCRSAAAAALLRACWRSISARRLRHRHGETYPANLRFLSLHNAARRKSAGGARWRDARCLRMAGSAGRVVALGRRCGLRRYIAPRVPAAAILCRFALSANPAATFARLFLLCAQQQRSSGPLPGSHTPPSFSWTWLNGGFWPANQDAVWFWRVAF